MFNFFKKRRSSGGQMKRRKTTKSGTKTSTNRNKRTNSNPRSGRVKGSVNTKTHRNFDAAPGATRQNPRAVKKSLTKDVSGGVKTKAGTYKTYKKDSAAAKSFRSAFASARKKGYKTFTWNGKKYNTKTK